jgi:copper(I)-binding protein
MLIGLKQDLKVDDEFEVVLHFKNSEDITLKVPVRDAAPEAGHMNMNE